MFFCHRKGGNFLKKTGKHISVVGWFHSKRIPDAICMVYFTGHIYQHLGMRLNPTEDLSQVIYVPLTLRLGGRNFSPKRPHTVFLGGSKKFISLEDSGLFFCFNMDPFKFSEKTPFLEVCFSQFSLLNLAGKVP